MMDDGVDDKDGDYLSQEDSDNLCHLCIGDPYLADEAGLGTRQACFHCGKMEPGLTLAELSERIHPVFEEWFQQVNEEHGSPVSEIIASIAHVDDDVAERIADQLSDDHGYMAVRDGGEDPYESFNHYAEVGVPRERQQERWQRFKESLLGEARYFNRHVETWLDDVFRDLNDHATWKGDPVIRLLEPDADKGFYRARWVQSETQLAELLGDPPARLGPPPTGTARAGRMNAAGISVFYGARDLETCIAEIRPPVGAHVAHGRFALTRPVRLLDLNVAENIVDDASYFDPDHDRKAQRAAIVRAIAKQIAWPVLPSDELFGYLPTQVIAEYLAERTDPQVDGILYRSTQTGSTGQNVVLFNRASRVEPLDLETHEVDVDLGWIGEEDYDDMISLRVKRKTKSAEPAPAPSGTFSIAELFEGAWEDLKPVPYDPRTVTLRFDFDSIGVERVTSATFKGSKRSVIASINLKPDESDTTPDF